MTKESKDVVAGLGEIGTPILQLISKATPAIGYDINEKLMDKKKFEKYKKLESPSLGMWTSKYPRDL